MREPPVAISPLTRHREHLPLLASWFQEQWPTWYGPGGRGDAEADVRAFASSETLLPVGLVAFRNGTPIGVGALKAESIPTHRHLGPWAAAGFVLPEFRGRGVGAMLLAALANHAFGLGFRSAYCGTATAVNLLRRGGWLELERVDHDGASIAIFRKDAS